MSGTDIMGFWDVKDTLLYQIGFLVFNTFN